jgi:hypothetical protein
MRVMEDAAGKARRGLALALLLGAAGAAAAGLAWAGIGLSSQFIDVVLANLKPGRSYNIRELKGVPYTVKNRGTSPVEVILDVVIPPKGYQRPPFEPIPDPTWVQVRPAKFRLGPGEAGYSDLIITLPDDEKLKDKHFMAQIWARTWNTGMLAAGVKSDIRFSVGKSPDTLEDEKRQKAMVDLNYDFYPASLYVRKAAVGLYDVKKEERRSFKVTNRSEKLLELVIRPIAWQAYTMTLPAGYEQIEDLKWVRFEPDTLTVDPDTVKEVKVILDVPERLKGRKLAFLVQLSLPIGVIVGAANQVYVEVP